MLLGRKFIAHAYNGGFQGMIRINDCYRVYVDELEYSMKLMEQTINQRTSPWKHDCGCP